jgi:predicted outer membrane protein
MKLRETVVLTALAVLAACGPSPQSSSEASRRDASSAQTATPASQFAARAAMFESYQIEAARIAQQSAQSVAAKAYATAALTEHQATLQQLVGAAQAAGMPAPSGALDENYNAYLDMLRHAYAQTFDTTYASQQALASMGAAGLYDSFTSTAPDSALKQWAQSQSQHVHDGVAAARQLASEAATGH